MRVEIKKGRGSLAGLWFYRFIGDDVPESLREGKWSDHGYKTKKQAEAEAKADIEE